MRDTILLQLAQIFDRPNLKFVNATVRYFHLFFTRMILIFVFKLKFPICFLSIRNSTKTGHRFNPFFSDLDLTLVIPDDFEEGETIKIENFYIRMRSILIFLGEIEIFKKSEYLEFLEIQRKNQSFIALIKDVRKLGWIVADQKLTNNAYQVYKSKRSIENMSLKWTSKSIPAAELFLLLGRQLEPFLIGLGNWGTSNDYSFDEKIESCSHLGTDAISEMGLTISSAWTLMAILPQDQSALKNLENIKMICSQNEKIIKLRQDYLRWEYLLLGAVFRGNSKKFPWMRGWMNEVAVQVLAY